MNVLPYLQAASAGTYLAAIAVILAGRWRAPALGHPWFAIATVAGFAADRALPGYAVVIAPLTFLAAAGLLVQIAGTRGGTRASLWRALASLPVLVIALVVAATSFSVADDRGIRLAEAILLALPAPAALAGALLPRVT